MAALLKLVGVSKSFGGVQALADLTLELRAGEVHALVGENGAGKSTLVKIITGAHQPDAGRIELDGGPIGELDPKRARQLGIAVIYQQPALFPALSVAENVAFGCEPPDFWRKVDWQKRHKHAVELLADIGAHIDPDLEAGHLTMPEQQLVEIARALTTAARVLILDEPTASLSEGETERLFSVIRRLKTRGVGVVYISHRLDELPQIADRVTVLRDGRVAGTASPDRLNRAEIIRMMVGREIESTCPRLAPQAGASLLETRGLSCRAGGVRNVSLSVRAGEIVGLAGLIGAGRTELAHALFGLTPADDGEILVSGRSVTIQSATQATALGLAYVPEDRRRHGVIQEFSVATNTSLAILPQLSRWTFLDFTREQRVAQDFVSRLGIKTPSVNSPVSHLSGGNHQKVELSRWLAINPRVLIVDEPTQGIDVGAKFEIHRLMNELTNRGLGILMISSDLPEVLAMSDRILVMRAGTIVGDLTGAAATQERVLELALGPGAIAEASA